MRLEEWTRKMRQSSTLVEDFMAALEIAIIAVIGRLATWIAPLPSAILVGRAAGQIFDLAGVWPAAMAATVELVGLVTSNLWLTAKEWNANKRKSDPSANEKLALGLMISYFVVAFLLLLAIEMPKTVATGDPTGLTALLFPGLSAVSLIALTERTAQSKRQAALDAEIAERKQQRTQRRTRCRVRQSSAPGGAPGSAPRDAPRVHQSNASTDATGATDDVLGAINRTNQAGKSARMGALVEAYEDDPDLGISDAAQILGVHRNTIYRYLDELEGAGRIRRNGDGVEVLA